ncbi:hypothetical protein NE865_14062 [Phthorimaea operculella]|nr:hypothetical protein NE865_14062 [Phthorimaea operculella]
MTPLGAPEKSIKLAGENRQRDEPLIPLEPREDSGIDSDEEGQGFQHPLMDVSDSEGDFEEEQRWVFTEGMDNVRFMQPAGGNCKCDGASKEHRMKEMDFESDRNSPPLYEVELTASDEDDDGSVLELVIPMQNSRYHRVPTASPKKGKIVAPTLFCNLFCCMRRTKA